ncbi:FeoA family protein [Parasphaerochaeta coccoides]|uniref:FeoA family protein n=1 Tax=Parasphaerochaeta coccoides (strain ATCC BAA-1237 / DSM 17374 / SPN1) TaxID=760011 RepID=F4GIP9_PARC1|nr:FeoA family protein [Parasphaerochaeta coccoides]AEC02183.1 FeoA family protein [Parasphaerochaeta coccoides DSM 17374]
MPLIFAEKGKSCFITDIQGRDKTKTFLSSLGFIPGNEVMVVSEVSGNLIVMVQGSRLAVDRNLATRIHVA